MVEGADSRRDAGVGTAAGVLAAQCSEMKRAVNSAEGWRNGKRPERDGLDDLIKAYYAVSSVMTLAETLKGTASDDGLSRLISDAESFVSERFDNVLHRDAKHVISDMMRDVTNELTLSSHAKLLEGRAVPGNGTAESEKYARLRSLMSVREFMGQYDAMVRDRAGLRSGGTGYGDDGNDNDADNGDHADDDGAAAALGESTGRNLDRSDAGP